MKSTSPSDSNDPSLRATSSSSALPLGIQIALNNIYVHCKKPVIYNRFVFYKYRYEQTDSLMTMLFHSSNKFKMLHYILGFSSGQSVPILVICPTTA